MSIERGSIGTSISRGPSASTASRQAVSFGRSAGAERGSYKSFSISKTGNITEKGGQAMTFRNATPTRTENRVSFKNFAEVKATGAMSLDKAIRPTSLQESKSMYQRPKESLWRNSIELKANKQAPRLAGLDSKFTERIPGATAPSLYERKAQTQVKVTLPKTFTEAKPTAKAPQTTWMKAQARYVEKKGVTNASPLQINRSEKSSAIDRQHVVQAKQVAPKTVDNLAVKAKEARLQTKPLDIKTQTLQLQQEYRKRFALPERKVNPVNKQTSEKQMQPKTAELAHIEAQKIMEQAAAVAQAAKKLKTNTAVSNNQTVTQDRLLQLVHDTLQKRGLAKYAQTEQQPMVDHQEQTQPFSASQTQRMPQVQLGTAERTATETALGVQGQEVLQPEVVHIPAKKTETSQATAVTQSELVQPGTQIAQKLQATTAAMQHLQALSPQEQTVTDEAAGVLVMTQEEMRARLQEQVQTETEEEEQTTLRREVKFVNGQFIIEQEEIVAERDPEADQERVEKAVEVGSQALGQAEASGQTSVTAHDIAARMPQKPSGGLISRIRHQLDLPLDTEKQYDTFRQVLAGTQQTLQSSDDIQQVATYATDVAPAVRLNTRITTEPVKPVDELRAVTNGEEKIVYLSQYRAQAA